MRFFTSRELTCRQTAYHRPCYHKIQWACLTKHITKMKPSYFIYQVSYWQNGVDFFWWTKWNSSFFGNSSLHWRENKQPICTRFSEYFTLVLDFLIICFLKSYQQRKGYFTCKTHCVTVLILKVRDTLFDKQVIQSYEIVT